MIPASLSVPHPSPVAPSGKPVDPAGHVATLALALIAANLLGWFALFRVESATLLAGLALLALDLRPGWRHPLQWRLGWGLAGAGLFDRLDWGLAFEHGDWLLGFAVGQALAWLPLRRRTLAAGSAMPDGFGRLALGAGGLCLTLLLERVFAHRLPAGWDGEPAFALQIVIVAALVALVCRAGQAREVVRHAKDGKGLVSPFEKGGTRGIWQCLSEPGRLEIPPIPPFAKGGAAASDAVGIGGRVGGREALRPLRMLRDLAALAALGFGARLVGGDVVWGGGLIALALWLAREPGPEPGRRLAAAAAGLVAIWFGLLAAFGSLFNLEVARLVAWNSWVLPLSERDFAWFALRDSYLWAERLERAPAVAGDPRSFVGAARLDGDRFSFAAPAGGRRPGEPRYHGFSAAYHPEGRIVMQVVPGSAADRAGLARGWVELDEPDAAGRARFRLPSGATRTVELGRGDETAVAADLLDWPGGTAGYLHLPAFATRFAAATEAAFRRFRAAGIGELVIDLRYNRGGMTSAAVHLASLVAGATAAGQPLIVERYNRRYRDLDNAGERIVRLPETLGLRRIFVLTTAATCSSSEALINGLRPFVEVVTIGATTCGKPWGYRPLRYRGTDYALISFEGRNVRGEGRYEQGIAPTCRATDPLAIAPGSRGDLLLAAARQYATSGRCPAGDGRAT